MTGLREHFAETAEAAKHYDVTDTVLRRARRHRALVRSVAAGAVALVATAGAAVLVDRPGPTPAVETIDATRPATAGRLEWLPPRFDAPADEDRLAPLPAGRGVGAGALIYRLGAASVLLTSDGASYRVPGEVRGLSPDGRWLVYSADDELVVHSLADGRIQKLADSDVAGWSVDGARVVLTLRHPDGRTPTVATVFRPDDGDNRTVPVPDPEWWAPRGLSTDGELILLPRRLFPEPRREVSLETMETLPPTNPTESPAPPAGTLPVPPSADGFGIAFVDPAARTARSVTMLASRVPGMDDPEEWHGGVDKAIYVRPDTGGLVFQPQAGYNDEDGFRAYRFGDVFEVDPTTGLPVRRFRLPTVNQGGTELHLVAVSPDGLLLTDDSDGRSRLEVLDPVTGERRTVSELSGDLRVELVRGGSYFWP